MQAIPDHTRLTAIAVVWNDFIAFSIFFQWLSKKKEKASKMKIFNEGIPQLVN
jgi:hypothetical protein